MLRSFSILSKYRKCYPKALFINNRAPFTSPQLKEWCRAHDIQLVHHRGTFAEQPLERANKTMKAIFDKKGQGTL